MSTQILLLEDVESVGRKGDIVKVKAGYAFNFLIPKKIALPADKNALRRQARLQAERQLKADEDRKISEEMSLRLKDQIFTKEVKVDHDGHMYGSVSSLDICHLIKNQTGVELDKRFVGLKHPIKKTGAYDLVLRLKEGIEVQIHVKVLAEGSTANEAA